jgi:hypothetical protein
VAVTQQLTRVDLAEVERCTASVDELAALCAFRGPDDDYLDLDWAPAPLERAARAAGVEQRLLALLVLATTGGAEVNPAYRDHPDTIFEHPVSWIGPDRVAEVSRGLDALAGVGFPSAEVAAAAYAGDPPEVTPDDPAGYLAESFADLRTFYAGAARRGLCTVLWWD